MKFIISSTSGESDYWKTRKTTCEVHTFGLGHKGERKDEVTVIEFSSLDELSDFAKEINQEVIISCKWYDIPEIEIYDSWRE